MASPLQLRRALAEACPDILTPDVLAALEALAPFQHERRSALAARDHRRRERAVTGQPITFLAPGESTPRTTLRVEEASAGRGGA